MARPRTSEDVVKDLALATALLHLALQDGAPWFLVEGYIESLRDGMGEALRVGFPEDLYVQVPQPISPRCAELVAEMLAQYATTFDPIAGYSIDDNTAPDDISGLEDTPAAAVFYDEWRDH